MSASEVLPRAAGASAPSPPRPEFRPDIEGLRAVAVGLVVAFHAGVGALGGGYVGVDVFFVISGFLITGLLADELRRSGTVSLTGFYARRIRRLLPLSAVVLISTAAAAAVLLPAIDRPDLAGDIRSAALWFANWNFAAGSTDYMSAVDHSPVLHYWSLSVEEQFYVVWPLVILSAVAALRRAGSLPTWPRQRRMLLRALVVLGTVSFVLSVLTSAQSGPWAYFGLHTRAWELAAGGCLALVVPSLRQLTKRAALVGGFLGAGAIVTAAVMFDRSTTFPGSAAAVPVIGTVLVLAAGVRTQSGVATVLGSRPFAYVGRISYGWYLWHWPVLVLSAAVWGQTDGVPDLGPTSGFGMAIGPTIAAVVASFLLAALTFRLVEQPVRRSPWLGRSRLASLGLGAALLVVSTVIPSLLLVDREVALPSKVTTSTGVVTATMTPAQARKDDGAVAGCFVDFATTVADPACRFGAKDGKKVVALIGDSHAAHWFPAMDEVARRNGWQLLFWAKPACSFADVTLFTKAFNRSYDECSQWRASVYQQLAEQPKVDAVVIGRSYSYLSTVMDADGGIAPAALAAQLWTAGAQSAFATLADVTASVVILREVPRPAQDIPSCLSANPGNADACGFARTGHVHLDAELFALEKTVLPPGDVVHYVDLTDSICPGQRCSVISPKGSIVFRDLHHLTATFAREMSGPLATGLEPYIGTR